LHAVPFYKGHGLPIKKKSRKSMMHEMPKVVSRITDVFIIKPVLGVIEWRGTKVICDLLPAAMLLQLWREGAAMLATSVFSSSKMDSCVRLLSGN
jgi:hypothetical protein